MKRVAMLVVLAALVSAGVGAQEAVRRGWNTNMGNGEPYNGCSWLVVHGPEAVKKTILDRAKRTYREVSPDVLASVEGKVVIDVRTVPERAAGCSNRVIEELIFVDKKTDTPALRIPVEPSGTALSNGFGAEWQTSDGVAVADLQEFREKLTDSYHVVIVFADGESQRIGQGFGMTVWSGGETKRVR